MYRERERERQTDRQTDRHTHTHVLKDALYTCLLTNVFISTKLFLLILHNYVTYTTHQPVEVLFFADLII